jgi:hypothetical protein
MSGSDVIKAALTNEIEENLSQSTNSIFKTKVIDVRLLAIFKGYRLSLFLWFDVL